MQASSSRTPPKRDLGAYWVGQKVTMQGTGPWWSGHHFRAQIVDIRKEDETVKVQYPDGGYKRFELGVFENSLVAGNTPDVADFGSQAYEWYHEHYAPDKHEPEDLRTQLTIATNFFSKLNLIVNPIWISCANKGGNKILKSRYHPAKCI